MSISSLPPGTAEAIDKFAAAQKAMEEAVSAHAVARLELIELLCPPGYPGTHNVAPTAVIYTIRKPDIHHLNQSATVESDSAVAL